MLGPVHVRPVHVRQPDAVGLFDMRPTLVVLLAAGEIAMLRSRSWPSLCLCRRWRSLWVAGHQADGASGSSEPQQEVLLHALRRRSRRSAFTDIVTGIGADEQIWGNDRVPVSHRLVDAMERARRLEGSAWSMIGLETSLCGLVKVNYRGAPSPVPPNYLSGSFGSVPTA